MSNEIENNPLEFSKINPMTEADGLEAVLGMINPKEIGQVKNDSVPETTTEEVVSELSEEEVEETPVETEEVELDESNEVGYADDIELEDSEYEYLVSAKEFLNENGLDNIDKIKNGILMQGDYTRKTQALAEEKKAFESERTQSLEKAAEVLEIAQAMVYGQQPKHTTQELLALKQSDPIAYEQALEAKILYEQKQAEIKDLTDKVGAQYQEQQQATMQARLAEQSEILIGLEPGFADEKVATEKVEVMSEYLKGIGGDPAVLNNVTDAIVIKVLHDAAMADKTQKQVSATKAPKKKTASKTVIRKGTSASKAEKQAAAQRTKLKNATLKDGSLDQQSAVDLIFDAFKG
jgi:hypothetical protein